MSGVIFTNASAGTTILNAANAGAGSYTVTIPNKNGELMSAAGGPMTGPIVGLMETAVALGVGSDINLAAGNLFTKTITGATTFTISNMPVAGTTVNFVLELTNGGAFAITWPGFIRWAGGVVPTLTTTGVDIFSVYTYDSGANWRAMLIAKDSK